MCAVCASSGAQRVPESALRDAQNFARFSKAEQKSAAEPAAAALLVSGSCTADKAVLPTRLLEGASTTSQESLQSCCRVAGNDVPSSCAKQRRTDTSSASSQQLWQAAGQRLSS